jgi:hypothetical protein
VLDQDAGFDVPQDQIDLVRLEAMIHRSHRRADERGREERFQEGGMVRSEPRDPIAVSDS